MSQVNDIIDAIKHRLPDRVNIYPALNSAVRLIAKRLRFHNLSMMSGALSVTVTADSASASLPSDFWGLISRPYISGKTYTLKPIPSKETELDYTSYSVPIYYKTMGQTIYLYPGSSSEITINGDYWQRPTKLTKPSDTMPYFEQFDDAISESLIHYYQTGKTSGDPNASMLLSNFLNAAVDEIAPLIEKIEPMRVVDNVSFDTMTNEGW